MLDFNAIMSEAMGVANSLGNQVPQVQALTAEAVGEKDPSVSMLENKIRLGVLFIFPPGSGEGERVAGTFCSFRPFLRGKEDRTRGEEKEGPKLHGKPFLTGNEIILF